MQHKSKPGLFLTAAFWGVLLVPLALWPLLRPYVDTEVHENRRLAEFPHQVSLADWPSAFEDWLNDHAPFRNQWMTLNAQLNWRVGTLDSTDVLLGKEHWLFLKDVGDSSSISDYQGLTAYSEEELAEFTATLQQLQTELEKRGSSLAVVLAPAKEGIYSRYMPDSIPVTHRPTRVQTLAAALQQGLDCPVIWPQQELCRAAETRQVYYKYDTHWNEAGAYIAAYRLMEALGTALPTPDEAAAAVDPGQTAPTDLANVSAAWTLCRDDPYYSVDVPKGDQLWQSDDGYFARWQGTGSQSLLMLRDSFGVALAPFVTAHYGNSLVLHGSALTVDVLNEQLPEVPDQIVLEATERFSENLLSQARILLAWLENDHPVA